MRDGVGEGGGEGPEQQPCEIQRAPGPRAEARQRLPGHTTGLSLWGPRATKGSGQGGTKRPEPPCKAQPGLRKPPGSRSPQGPSRPRPGPEGRREARAWGLGSS